jgi:outer membrane protein assembly factor BamA
MRRVLSLTLVLGLQALCQTRTAELEKMRAEHQRASGPETASRVEEFLRRIKDDKILERINYGYNGLGVRLGGLVTGGGFAVGPQYLRNDLADGAVVVRAAAQISTRNYRKADAQLVLPRLIDNKAAFDLRSTYRNYSSIQYYGPGPDSPKTRTNYRLEDTSIDGTFAIRPTPRTRVGGGLGLLAVNVSPGQDSRFASTDAHFSPAEAPGIDAQSHFLRYGVFGGFDGRDDPFGPRHGGSYVAQYTRYEDTDLRRHDFNLFEIDLQQYIGLLNRTRIIALRARTRMTDSRDGQTTPFYLQPVVGGSDDLRGFRPFRFSGQNSLVLNGEYRWAIFAGCDGAVFVDGGKVFNRSSQLNFHDLEGSMGFGLRFNARNRTFIRIDVGFSHEGVQVWFKFNDIFQQRPLGTADSQPIL